jgi:hypothetical protein
MRRYLDDMLKLYPGAKMYPVQHLGLHFSEFMAMLGPSHAYRCYGFERCNWILQRLPTNMKFGMHHWVQLCQHFSDQCIGELEPTMLRRFCQGQNLHALFSRPQIPHAIHKLVPVFEAAFKDGKRGTLFSDGLAFAQNNERDDDNNDDDEAHSSRRTILDLSDDVYSLLQDWVAKHDNGTSNIRHLRPSGLCFSKFDRL